MAQHAYQGTAHCSTLESTTGDTTVLSVDAVRGYYLRGDISFTAAEVDAMHVHDISATPKISEVGPGAEAMVTVNVSSALRLDCAQPI